MQSRIRTRHRFINPFLMWSLVAVGVFLAMAYAPVVEVFERTFLGAIIFLLVLGYWVYFFINAVLVHRKAALSVERVDKLVMSGVYGLVRHPIYSADIFLVWGFLLVFPNLKMLVSAAWLTFVLTYWMILEENALEEKFGREYREYAKKVPMVIPHINNLKK